MPLRAKSSENTRSISTETCLNVFVLLGCIAALCVEWLPDFSNENVSPWRVSSYSSDLHAGLIEVKRTASLGEFELINENAKSIVIDACVEIEKAATLTLVPSSLEGGAKVTIDGLLFYEKGQLENTVGSTSTVQVPVGKFHLEIYRSAKAASNRGLLIPQLTALDLLTNEPVEISYAPHTGRRIDHGGCI